MKNGVAYIALSDGKVHFFYRQDKTTEPLILSASVESDKAALQMVVRLAADNSLPLEQAVIAIDSRHSILRNYCLPVQGKRQLDQMVAFQVAEDVPVPAEELVFDHFRGNAAGGISYVMSAAVRRDALSYLLDEAELQGLDILRVDLDVAAFARSCATGFSEHDGCVGLEVGQERTLFCYQAKGRTQRLAVIPWGENLLAESVARDLGVSRDEVDRLMLFPGSDSEDGNGKVFVDVLGEHLQIFVRKLVREAQRQLGDMDWPSLFVLSGEIVRLQDFRGTFEDVAVSRLAIWDEYCLKLGDEFEAGQRGSGLATVHGVAEESGDAFNFRKGEFHRPDSASVLQKQLWHAAVVLLSLGVAWGAYAYASLVSGERELAYLNAATREVYAAALPDVNDSMALVQYQSILASRLSVLTGDSNAGGERALPVIEILRSVSRVLDKKVDVEFISMSLDGKQIDLQGETKSMASVEKVRTAFVKTKAFKDVKIKSATVDKRSRKVRFEIGVER